MNAIARGDLLVCHPFLSHFTALVFGCDSQRLPIYLRASIHFFCYSHLSLDNIRHPLLPPIYRAALTFLIRIRAMPFIGGQPLPGVVALEHLPRRWCGPIGVYVSRFCDDLVRTGSKRVG